jgi:hypothetical protein
MSKQNVIIIATNTVQFYVSSYASRLILIHIYLLKVVIGYEFKGGPNLKFCSQSIFQCICFERYNSKRPCLFVFHNIHVFYILAENILEISHELMILCSIECHKTMLKMVNNMCNDGRMIITIIRLDNMIHING